jgi:hypothetical protein
MGINKRRIGILAAVLVVGLFLMAGCSGKSSDEQMAEDMARKMIKQTTGKDVDVKMQGGKIEFKGRDFKSEITETTVWPADMFPEVRLPLRHDRAGEQGRRRGMQNSISITKTLKGTVSINTPRC